MTLENTEIRNHGLPESATVNRIIGGLPVSFDYLSPKMAILTRFFRAFVFILEAPKFTLFYIKHENVLLDIWLLLETIAQNLSHSIA